MTLTLHGMTYRAYSPSVLALTTAPQVALLFLKTGWYICQHNTPIHTRPLTTRDEAARYVANAFHNCNVEN